MIRRASELDSTYFYGAGFLLTGSIYGLKPRIMGGDPSKAGLEFEKNFKINENRFLLAHVYAARYYAAKILNEELFNEYISHVLQTPADVMPEIQLLNQIAKKKAEKLKLQKENLF